MKTKRLDSNINSTSARRLAHRSKGTENIPHPYALIAAMRNMGYTPPTALADLVDNCITAGAKKIAIRVCPPNDSKDLGYVSVEDDGTGMSSDKLFEAMRWGGKGPKCARSPEDLGRFGLGMKTASLSMGSVLTVATRHKRGSKLQVVRWDLEHVERKGWELLVGPDQQAESALNESLLSNANQIGTIVVISRLDRLSMRTTNSAYAERNEAETLRKVSRHLGMVFHQFLTEGVEIKLGSTPIIPWDPFETSDLKDKEQLGGGAEVRSYILPHHSRITKEQHNRLAGPLGWLTHQGFFVYRVRRLIAPGGWFRLFPMEEACRLARIKVDLPNTDDQGWSLNVMKSSVMPPSWAMADFQRIGEATRRHARAIFNFRGERQAPRETLEDSTFPKPFWNQIPTEESIRFRINRAHPIVQTLKLSLKDPALAESFLKTFEKLLPIDAILQDPRGSTNGAQVNLNEKDLDDMVLLVKRTVHFLLKQGHDLETAKGLVLSAEPFSFFRSHLESQID